MLQFFKYVLATVVGLFAFIVLIILLGSLFSPGDGLPEVKENSVLKLNLNSPITELSEEDPFEDLDLPIASGTSGLSLIELLQSIQYAKTDENIKGIYLDARYTAAGFASLQELRDALLDFKKSGKFVVAYGEIYTEGAYYLASTADQIHLNPIGLVELNGLSSEVPFIKGTLEKLEVKPLIFKVGDFKSAVEPFFLDKMSDANREQVTSYLNSIYDLYLKNVAESRELSIEKLREISDSMLVRDAETALQYQLINNISYEDEVQEVIKSLLKLKKDEKIEYIGFKNYSKVAKAKGAKKGKNRIAVIVAEGEIVDGQGDNTNIGGDRFAEEIRKARLNKDIKAVVLRINSPGGSALASDIMWREVQLLKKEKPVIASMSDLAASGGYYMAMGCDTIVAQPNTITGSIGIFGVLFEAEDLLKNKIGVTTDRVNTGGFSDLGNPSRKMTEAEKQIIQNQVNRGYEIFTTKAAEGRNMPIEALLKVASGRVWTGAQAKERGLVDVLGNLDDAIAIAAQKAGVADDYRVRIYPSKPNFLDRLLKRSSPESVKQKMLQDEMGEFYTYYQQAKRLQNLRGIQARLPFEVVFK